MRGLKALTKVWTELVEQFAAMKLVLVPMSRCPRMDCQLSELTATFHGQELGKLIGDSNETQILCDVIHQSLQLIFSANKIFGDTQVHKCD